MARLVDDYQFFKSHTYTPIPIFLDKECKVIKEYVECERIAKPKTQTLIYRILDAYNVLIGRYDAVYYHEHSISDEYTHYAKDGDIIHHSFNDAIHIVDGGGYSHSVKKSKSQIKLANKMRKQWN